MPAVISPERLDATQVDGGEDRQTEDSDSTGGCRDVQPGREGLLSRGYDVRR